jgi:DNA-binding IclR family transcriptional regulator
MSTIDDVIMLLKDGKWHDIQEVTETVALPKPKTEMIISFLKEYDFIQHEEGTKKIRLQASMLEFIEAIQRLENTGI